MNQARVLHLRRGAVSVYLYILLGREDKERGERRD